MSDRQAFAREKLISLIIDVGMLRRDVATDVADAILTRSDSPLREAAMVQRVGWAEPGEFPSEVHEDVSEFVLDHHSGAGDSVLEIMPVFVGPSKWAVTCTYATDEHATDEYEDVTVYDTLDQARAADAKNDAEAEANRLADAAAK